MDRQRGVGCRLRAVCVGGAPNGFIGWQRLQGRQKMPVVRTAGKNTPSYVVSRERKADTLSAGGGSVASIGNSCWVWVAMPPRSESLVTHATEKPASFFFV